MSDVREKQAQTSSCIADAIDLDLLQSFAEVRQSFPLSTAVHLHAGEHLSSCLWRFQGRNPICRIRQKSSISLQTLTSARVYESCFRHRCRLAARHVSGGH